MAKPRRASYRIRWLLLLLLGLSSPVPATDPTLGRLAVWVPPEQMEEFAALYADTLAPLLTERGLVSSTESGRATPDSIFSRLFVLEAPETAASIDADLQRDPAWKEALRKARTTLEAAPPDTAPL